MRPFSCSIDMSRLPRCRASAIAVKQSGEHLFWCTAVLGSGGPEVDLGPVVLGFDGVFTERWNAQAKALVGGEDETAAFFAALGVFLGRREVAR